MARKKNRQPEASLFALRCEECGEYMVQTESGYLCCPRGHGKLNLDAPPAEEPCGSWFDAESERDTCALLGSETDVVGGL